MRNAITYTIIAASVIIGSAVIINRNLERNGAPAIAAAESGTVEIPASIETEHKAIHEALLAATQMADPVGKAARDLAAVLHPHFVREEQIALPPLGVLRALASNAPVENATMIAAMSDTLRAELPRMLAEHAEIRNAVVRLREVAATAGAHSVVEFADELALHALTEEEVLYPAAVLVGMMLERD